MASDNPNGPVLTAPLGIIKVNGVTIGKMRNIRINENISRGRVQGVGALTLSELPALSYVGTLTCDSYNVTYKKSAIPDSLNTQVQTVQQFVDSVLLQEEGVEVQLFKKVPKVGQPRKGNIESTEDSIATIRNLFLDSKGMDISEGAISGKNQSFTFTEPIIYPQ